jgi:D-3-phosphoglycerate dehydrogenase
VAVRVQGADGVTRGVEGILGTDGSARLVKWGDFEIEAHLGGATLVVTSIDTPGLVGFLGTTLGNARINVARVHLGMAGGGRAVSIWNLDQPPPPAVLDEVRRSPNVRAALSIQV